MTWRSVSSSFWATKLPKTTISGKTRQNIPILPTSSRKKSSARRRARCVGPTSYRWTQISSMTFGNTSATYPYYIRVFLDGGTPKRTRPVIDVLQPSPNGIFTPGTTSNTPRTTTQSHGNPTLVRGLWGPGIPMPKAWRQLAMNLAPPRTWPWYLRKCCKSRYFIYI